MRKAWEITGDDIELWSQRIDAAADLPRLVRRLLAATAPLATVEMRGDGGTRFEGWDGVVEAADARGHCPRGLSVWEMSVTKATGTKLDKDFEKRAKAPPPPVSETKHVTYVAVLARRYSDKQAWMQRQRARKLFADVRVYDADDLAEWLERAPAVGRWFASRLGLPAEDGVDVQAYLDAWSRRTSPPLPWDLVLSGRQREEQAAEVLRWLSHPPAIPLRVQAETREEAVLFIGAAIAKAPDAVRWLSRAMFVDTKDGYERALAVQRAEPLIVIPTFDGADAAKAKPGQAYVVLAVDPRVKVERGEALVLDELPHKALTTKLIAGGQPKDAAEKLVREAGGKLAAMQRLCGYIELPEWAKGSSRPELFAMLLAGGWVAQNEGDRAVITRLGGDSSLVELLCKDFEKTGEIRAEKEHWSPTVWRWSSPRDAWKALSGGLSDMHLVRFRDVVWDVLGAEDPRYELPPDQRFAAAVHGKVLQHSSALREGLAISLVMLGQHGHEKVVDGLVARLLAREKEWRAWASLSSLLPTIAEAAPNAFLDAVEASLDAGDKGIAHLFVEEGRSGGMGSTPHTGLLWALETLGWSPDPLMVRRVVLALARWAETDREGNLPGKIVNRPINSLSNVLSFWLPQSTTTVDERISLFRNVLERHIDVAQVLLQKWMTERGDRGMMSPSQRPIYLQWTIRPKDAVIYEHEADEQLGALIDAILHRIGHDPASWAILLQHSGYLPEGMGDKILHTLEQRMQDINDVDGIVWGALRDRVGAEYFDSEQDTPRLQRLTALCNEFKPNDIFTKVRWLFAPNPTLPEAIERDYEKKEDRLRELRIEGMNEVWKEQDRWAILERLSASVADTWSLAISVGWSDAAREFEERLRDGTISEPLSTLIKGFAAACIATNGHPWLKETLLALVAAQRLNDAVTVALGAPLNIATWRIIEEIGVPLSDRYWSGLRSFRLPLRSAEEAEYAIGRLLGAHQEALALQLASLQHRSISPSTALHVLERFRDRYQQAGSSSERSKLALNIQSHYLNWLFERIDTDPSIAPDRVLTLELFFLDRLAESKRKPRRFSEAIRANPDIFVNLIRTMYGRRGEAKPPENPTEEERRVFENAYRILEAWNRAKGHPGEGLPASEREAAIETWAAEVLQKTAADGRAKVGTIEVAKVLARAPEGADSVWPCIAARRLLESGQYPDLGQFIQTAKRNLRGVHGRALDEGGKQERELAEQFRGYADTVKDEYPRTAAMLDALARTYAQEAEEHDAEARRHRVVHGDDEAETSPPPTPPRHGPEAPGGPLSRLSITGLDVSPKLELNLAPRLNILTGDNGLGKTVALDVAWWALTHAWADKIIKPARRRTQNGKIAKTNATISATAGERSMTAVYEPRHERWAGGRPLAHNLVLYARVDGSFSIWDPIRNSPPANDGDVDLSKGYHLSSQEIWDGKPSPGAKTPLCDGLINDAVRWRSERRDAFDMLEKALQELSPPETPIEFGLPRRFSIHDPRDYPTLVLPYGTIFAPHASAAVKRILGFAYMLVWAVAEVRRAAALAERAPITHVTFLIDEVEAHLHPKWQRTIMAALLSVVEKIKVSAPVQILATTHAPLVLASLEPYFETNRDALFDFDLVDVPSGGKKVDVENEPWRLVGDVNAWLTSSIFGLKEPRNTEAEKWLERAARAVGTPDNIDRKEVRKIHRKLQKLLGELDPFWVRWRFLGERQGWLP